MKLRRIFAAIAACAVAATSIVSASAYLVETKNEESAAPEVTVYKYAAKEGVDYSKVAKIEAVVTTDDYVNGTIGVSCDGTWTTCDQQEATGGTATTWTLDGLSGIDSTMDEAGTLKEDAVQVQFWWLNAGSLYLSSVTLYDADGNVLDQVKDDAPSAPAESTVDSTKPADSTADSTKPADDSNKPTGATAGLALAGLALAGVAVVAAKKSK